MGGRRIHDDGGYDLGGGFVPSHIQFRNTLLKPHFLTLVSEPEDPGLLTLPLLCFAIWRHGQPRSSARSRGGFYLSSASLTEQPHPRRRKLTSTEIAIDPDRNPPIAIGPPPKRLLLDRGDSSVRLSTALPSKFRILIQTRTMLTRQIFGRASLRQHLVSLRPT